MTSFEILLLISGVFWTLTYLLILRQGVVDRTYGMPVVALCANLSWEIIFTLVHPHGLPQVAVNAVWLVFDLGIVIQTLRFGPREWKLPPVWFYALFVVSLLVAFPGVLLITYELYETDKGSGAYAAFGQNLMMSVLFVEFLRQRPDGRGQSLGIGICKWIGTGFASLGFLLYTELGTSWLMRYLFLSIFVFDALYVALLIVAARRKADRAQRTARALPQRSGALADVAAGS